MEAGVNVFEDDTHIEREDCVGIVGLRVGRLSVDARSY